MGVVGVRQKVDVEAKGHVANGGDLILGRPPRVEQTGGGELELLQSVETQTLHKPAFDLSDEQKQISGVVAAGSGQFTFCLDNQPGRCQETDSRFSRCP